MKTSPLNKIFRVLTGLSVAAVLGAGFYSGSPVEERASSVAPRRIADGQETHGKNGGKGRALRIADGSGQETHGGKGGKGIA